ncbi:MAG: HAD-IA family hydrolase [Planctomycetes bacterium]|nr:HAD-IA family hydrolase [Planctomycetota bacterium]
MKYEIRFTKYEIRNMAQIQAILFDIGETLLNFGKVDAAALFKEGTSLAYDFLKKLGVPLGSFRIYLIRHSLAIRLHLLLSAVRGRDFDSYEVLKKIQIRKGIQLKRQQWIDYARLWYEPLRKIASVEPDITETLKELKRMGLKLGVLSNTFVNASTLGRHLEQLGMLEFFDVRLYSYEYPFRKPDKRIFLAAAKKLDIEPENILFVGDRIDTDINGSVAAGMRPCLKKAYTNINKTPRNNVMKVDKLSELPGLVENINTGQKESNNVRQ